MSTIFSNQPKKSNIRARFGAACLIVFLGTETVLDMVDGTVELFGGFSAGFQWAAHEISSPNKAFIFPHSPYPQFHILHPNKEPS